MNLPWWPPSAALACRLNWAQSFRCVLGESEARRRNLEMCCKRINAVLPLPQNRFSFSGAGHGAQVECVCVAAYLLSISGRRSATRHRISRSSLMKVV
jgi:hypothetical protein